MRALAPLLVAAGFSLGAPPQVSIVKAVLHQFEDGPPLPANHRFYPGETVFLSFQVSGFTTKAKDSDRFLHLRYLVEAQDPAGVNLAAPQTGEVKEQITPEDKDWLPKIRYHVLVPPEAGSGAYKLKIGVKDEFGANEATREVPFEVQGRAVEPGPALAVRNFRFLRNEDDATPLAAAAYRPGDAVWARFDIIGYKYGEKNRIQVEYGLEVLRPSGALLYQEPKAAAVEEASFYPKRYVPGILSLQLTPDITKGEYTIVLKIKDGVGGQEHETRHAFRIE